MSFLLYFLEIQLADCQNN